MKIIVKIILTSLTLTIKSVVFSQKIDWEKVYGGTYSEYLSDAIATADYGYILAGSSLSNKDGNKIQKNSGHLDYWIWKMNEYGQQEWQQSFGGEGKDELISIDLTKDGGYILGGISNSNQIKELKSENNYGLEDIWIIKLDAKGNLEWEKTIGGEGSDLLTKIISLKDGGYLIGGNSSSNQNDYKSQDSNGNLDYWVIKLDQKGDKVWEKTFGGKYLDILKDINITNDGNIIIGGQSNSPISATKTSNSTDGDVWILKLSMEGDILWERTYGLQGVEDLTNVIQTKDNQYLIAGTTTNMMAKKGQDIWLYKFDEQNNTILNNVYNIGYLDNLSSLTENPDGTLVLSVQARGGLHNKKSEGIDDYSIIKIDRNGNEIWKKTIENSGNNIIKRTIVTRDGHYLLAGVSDANKPSKNKKSSIGNFDYWVVKMIDEEKETVNRKPIEAYPNPTSSFTNIILNHDYDKGIASIIDIDGRVISKLDIQNNRTIPINISNLPTGIYIIHIKTNVQEDSIKILKK